MSKRPKSLGLKLPTGAENAWPSFQGWNLPSGSASPSFSLSAASPTLAADFRVSALSPLQKRVEVPARHAYSHSASVGSRYFLPSLRLSHSQNLTASFQLTLATGCSSFCSKPEFFQ